MKTTSIFPILVISFLFLFTACDTETIGVSTNVTTITQTTSDYNRLSVTGNFNVYVNLGTSSNEIEIEANENLQEHIIIENEDNMLTIRLDDIIIDGDETLNIYLSPTSIIEYRGLDNVDFIINGNAIENDMHIKINDGSTFTGHVEVSTLVLDANNFAKTSFSGSADLFDVNASGNCTIKECEFVTNNLDATLFTNSSIHATVNGDINIFASGFSHLYYKGTGVVKEKVLMNGSTISKID